MHGQESTACPNPTPDSADLFGSSVATFGTRIFVGSPGGDAGGNFTGEAFIFNSSNGNLFHTLTDPTPAGNEQFGMWIVAQGIDVIVGTLNGRAVSTGGKRG